MKSLLEKVTNLFNLRAWIEGVLFKKVISKGMTGAVAIITGFIGSAMAADKIRPIIDTILGAFNITLTPKQIEDGVTVLVGALVAALWNWLKHGPFKDKNLPELPTEIKKAA